MGCFRRRIERRKEELAVLQLTGNIEDYLVKEFAVAVSDYSCGRWFAATIGGTKLPDGDRQPRVDICILDAVNHGDWLNEDGLTIIALIEAKYFVNSRLLGFGRSASVRYDKNVRARTKELADQARRLQFCKGTLGGLRLRPIPEPERCALVLAGYVHAENQGGARPRGAAANFDQRSEDDVFGRLQGALEDAFLTDASQDLRTMTASYRITTSALGRRYSAVLKTALLRPRPVP
jgi:hypothetical protein